MLFHSVAASNMFPPHTHSFKQFCYYMSRCCFLLYLYFRILWSFCKLFLLSLIGFWNSRALFLLIFFHSHSQVDSNYSLVRVLENVSPVTYTVNGLNLLFFKIHFLSSLRQFVYSLLLYLRVYWSCVLLCPIC